MSLLQYMEETWVGYDDMEAPVTLLFRPSLIIVGCLRKHFSWYLAHVKQRGSLALSFWTSGRWCSSWNLKVYGRAGERAEAHCHQSRPSAQRGQISSTRQNLRPTLPDNEICLRILGDCPQWFCWLHVASCSAYQNSNLAFIRTSARIDSSTIQYYSFHRLLQFPLLTL